MQSPPLAEETVLVSVYVTLCLLFVALKPPFGNAFQALESINEQTITNP